MALGNTPLPLKGDTLHDLSAARPDQRDWKDPAFASHFGQASGFRAFPKRTPQVHPQKAPKTASLAGMGQGGRVLQLIGQTLFWKNFYLEEAVAVTSI